MISTTAKMRRRGATGVRAQFCLVRPTSACDADLPVEFVEHFLRGTFSDRRLVRPRVGTCCFDYCGNRDIRAVEFKPLFVKVPIELAFADESAHPIQTTVEPMEDGLQLRGAISIQPTE
jgi:hypothetical protein